ncbi:OstA-like protein [Sphingobacterium lumbrici]|uniref:OstA-like protein n=1 Tax=Sphingobacterium lumbrici TaxID=2559600 RepID=UPI001F1C4170|nr:OstA-like protein [Sphingobacterium lumbrici]
MKYWSIFIFFVVGLQLTFGQTPIGGTPVQQGGGQDRLNLVSASSGRINATTGHMIFYRPVYEHKGSTLSADSGYIYEDEVKRQFFEAFGNVIVTQPSGSVIYSDRLHYDAAMQHARLTNNVKMVDGTSTLTTNFLTYNMRSKVGTYTGGGRIVSQGDTITSKNAYYFENTKDAYFRNTVIVRTPNVKIYTDSMRYNSVGKMTYFSGPTNIKDNTEEKNLYTERGHYNTGTGIADFNKNNLYTEGTKFLKGDSLHYERESGIGTAYRNVVFVDTLDKFYAYGGFGLYRQSDESITMTEKPLIITLVKNDSIDNDAKIDSTENTAEAKSHHERRQAQQEWQKQEKLEADTDSIATIESEITPPELKEETKMDSVYLTADTLFSKVIPLKEYIALDLKLDRSGGELIVEDDVDYGDNDDSDLDAGSIDLDTDSAALTLNLDSGKTVIDSLEKIDILQQNIPDSTLKSIPQKPVIQTKKTQNSKKEEPPSIEATIKADSLMRQNAVIPTGSEADSLLNNALKVAQTQDTTTKNISMGDSTTINAVSDTARTRIVKAYYNVRLFKSDLQAVADSVYYGMADSMFRFMGRPMIWAQGSQISADTIFMQILNQQLDNALLKENAMMVNAVLDTVRFNQLKGRKITAFFTNNNIDRLYVDGNAENLIFTENAELGIITEMFHDRGARIKIKMEGKKIIDYVSVRKVDQKVYPLKLVNQENEILPGFIWRPQDRPTSKEDLLNRKRETPKAEEVTELPPATEQTEQGTESKSLETDPIEAVRETEAMQEEL